jgi:hypothetical protein
MGVASDAMPSGPVRRPPHELTFAAAIRAARVEADLTQADLAEQAGLPCGCCSKPNVAGEPSGSSKLCHRSSARPLARRSGEGVSRGDASRAVCRALGLGD